mmetsp:Transcript_14430/g.25834  ORF Transcript_14430/g.25834 Transcript_14430/m.25834 type:complete len:201 (-) Transcript_14430:196-798(-)
MKSIKATSRSIGTCASSIQRTIGTNGTLTVPHRRINQRLINNRQYQYRYKGTTTSAENNTISAEVKGEVQEHHASSMTTHPPSARQLMVHALRSAVPMIGTCIFIYYMIYYIDPCILVSLLKRCSHILSHALACTLACKTKRTYRIWFHGQHHNDTCRTLRRLHTRRDIRSFHARRRWHWTDILWNRWRGVWGCVGQCLS